MTDRVKEQVDLRELPEYFQLRIIDKHQTGINLYQLTDTRTGAIVTFAEFNPDIDIHSFSAWAAARVSRAGKTFEQLFTEIYEAVREGLSTGAKLAEVFSGYGHASVADMAPVFLYLDEVPQVVPFQIFYRMSVGAGQEESTRYVKIGEFGIPEISHFIGLDNIEPQLGGEISSKWQDLQAYASTLYNKWIDLVREGYLSQFGETIEGLGEADKKRAKNALKNRVLDIARLFIPEGSLTAQAVLNSVRAWVEIGAQMKASHIPACRMMGEQISTILQIKQFEGGENIQADLSGFTKYDYPRELVGNNLQELKYFLLQEKSFQELLNNPNASRVVNSGGSVVNMERHDVAEGYTMGMLVAMQYIHSLFPNLEQWLILQFIANLPEVTQIEISSIIFSEHNRFNQMNNLADIRSGVVLEGEMAVAFARDLNRARAAGRYIPKMETTNVESVLNDGFQIPEQFRQTEGLLHLEDDFVCDMQDYYAHLKDLFYLIKGLHLPDWDDTYIYYLLPMGHQITMNMSFPPNQLVYTGDLRWGAKGGDINYMAAVEMMVHLSRSEDPLLAGILPDAEDLDYNSFEQFIERS